MAAVPDDVQRWTAKRRVALVLSIVRGETSVAEAAPKHGLTVAEIEEWQERFLAAAENALRALEAACIERFGTLRPDGATPVLRSDKAEGAMKGLFREGLQNAPIPDVRRVSAPGCGARWIATRSPRCGSAASDPVAPTRCETAAR
jgi:hypothetical protein